MVSGGGHFWRYGAPFLTFMLAGTYGLSYVTRGRIEVGLIAHVYLGAPTGGMSLPFTNDIIGMAFCKHF